ncbi:MAG: (Fe-S)-binding protein [Desulfobacter sp.]
MLDDKPKINETTAPSVGLFYTCLVDAFRPAVGVACVTLLENAGYRVIIPRDQTCCGRPAYRLGAGKAATRAARQMIPVFEPFDYVVGPSGTCMAMFSKHYPELLRDDPHWHERALALAEKSFELTDFLARIACIPPVHVEYNGVVTFHDSCTGLRELNIKEQPRQLLSTVRGLDLREMATPETCCGFGGSFSAKFPQISSRMTADKLEDILSTGADTLAGGDLGCLMNIEGQARKMKSPLKVFHTAEILAGMTLKEPQ